nr:homeodomain-like protein [Tanacetum cinerariifolium]
MMELTLEEYLSMFTAKIAKGHDENTNLIKELRASTDFALRNQKASIKALEIQVRQISIIMHEILSGISQSSIEIKQRVNDETISTSVKADKPSIRRIDASQYVVSNLKSRNLFFESKKMTLPSPSHLNDDYWDEFKEANGEKDPEAYYTDAKPLSKALSQKKKDPESFTLPCFINNMFFNKALADLGASIKARVMGNALRKNRSYDPKFRNYIELSDLNEPLELSHDQVVDLGPTIEKGEVIDTPIKELVKTRHDDDKITNGIKDYPSFSNPVRKIHVNDAYNLRFFCMIGYEHVDINFFHLLSINIMSKRFYNSIIKDKLEFKGKSIVEAFMNAPIFVGTFSVVIDFVVIEDMDHYRDEEMGDVIVGKPFCEVLCVETKKFDGMITIHDDDVSVTYQMVWSHPRFKRHTNEQCNKIMPLLKVSEKDKMNEISHSYQKLKGFYKEVLNLGPDFIRDPSMEE